MIQLTSCGPDQFIPFNLGGDKRNITNDVIAVLQKLKEVGFTIINVFASDTRIDIRAEQIEGPLYLYHRNDQGYLMLCGFTDICEKGIDLYSLKEVLGELKVIDDLFCQTIDYWEGDKHPFGIDEDYYPF